MEDVKVVGMMVVDMEEETEEVGMEEEAKVEVMVGVVKVERTEEVGMEEEAKVEVMVEVVKVVGMEEVGMEEEAKVEVTVVEEMARVVKVVDVMEGVGKVAQEHVPLQSQSCSSHMRSG